MGAAKRGDRRCRAEGSTRRYPTASGKPAMHLCMSRDYRMLLANNGPADTGRVTRPPSLRRPSRVCGAFPSETRNFSAMGAT